MGAFNRFPSADSNITLRSGMALQMDISSQVSARSVLLYQRSEDGIVLADEKLSSELAEKFPACWEADCERRRAVS